MGKSCISDKRWVIKMLGNLVTVLEIMYYTLQVNVTISLSFVVIVFRLNF